MEIKISQVVDLPEKKVSQQYDDFENGLETGRNMTIDEFSSLPISKDKVIGMVEFKREKLINVIKKVLKPSCSCNNGIGIVCVGCFYVKDIVNEIVSAKSDILTIKGVI